MQTQHLGNGTCFDSLRAITDRGDDFHKSKVARYLQTTRLRVKALEPLAPEHRRFYLNLARTQTLKDVEQAKLPPDVADHLKCCIVAIFREAIPSRA